VADADVAAFAESIELAAVNAYGSIAPLLPSDLKPVGELFAKHHQDHANAFRAVAGEAARGVPNNALAAALAARLRGVTDRDAALDFAFGLENQIAATYAWALTVVQGIDLASVMATVLPIQSAHAGVLGVSLGKASRDLFPTGALIASAVGGASDEGLGFDPVRFPVG